MTTKMRGSRTQICLARGLIVGAVTIFVTLVVFGTGPVRSVTTGEVTVYSAPRLVLIVFVAMGVLIGGVAVAYWMQGGRFHRWIGIGLGLVGIYVLFNSPTGLDHRVVVAPDYFYHRVGPWYSPVETKIDYEALAYMTVDAARIQHGKNEYELRCYKKGGGEPIRIPIYDMMKKALPEILGKAAAHNVLIGENPDGRQIPADL